MSPPASLAETASLIADPSRAGMLMALMDGRALTAGELATTAGITPQTASAHLARLVAAGLLQCERQGRHHYHRLATPAVAHLLETLLSAAVSPTRRVRTGPRDQAMKRARTCYDHLAGELAVALADRMVERGQVELSADGGALTQGGVTFLRNIGVDLDAATARAARRGGPVFCRPCLDWSERRPHIAGAIGTALCQLCLDRAWLRRIPGTRALQVSPAGRAALECAFGPLT